MENTASQSWEKLPISDTTCLFHRREANRCIHHLRASFPQQCFLHILNKLHYTENPVAWMTARTCLRGQPPMTTQQIKIQPLKLIRGENWSSNWDTVAVQLLVQKRHFYLQHSTQPYCLYRSVLLQRVVQSWQPSVSFFFCQPLCNFATFALAVMAASLSTDCRESAG